MCNIAESNFTNVRVSKVLTSSLNKLLEFIAYADGGVFYEVYLVYEKTTKTFTTLKEAIDFYNEN